MVARRSDASATSSSYALASLAISASVRTLISGWTRLGRSMLEIGLLRIRRQTTARRSMTLSSRRWFWIVFGESPLSALSAM